VVGGVCNLNFADIFITERCQSLSDYLEEINTALATKGEDIYYQSLDDLKSDLETKSEYHEDRAIHFGTGAASVSGAGIAGVLNPGFYSQATEILTEVPQSDFATIGLIGSLGVSVVPGYIAKRHKDEKDEINQIIQELENGDHDQDTTDFAYRVADKL